MAEWLLYEHDDGRHAVAPSAEAATFAHGDPAWHRVGPVEVPSNVDAVLTEVVKWALAGHNSEAGVTVEAGKAIRAAVSGVNVGQGGGDGR